MRRCARPAAPSSAAPASPGRHGGGGVHAARSAETRRASSSSGRCRAATAVCRGVGSASRRGAVSSRPVEPAEPLDGAPHGRAVRAVARLPDGRLPAAHQPFAGPFAERLAQQLVEVRPRTSSAAYPRSRRGSPGAPPAGEAAVDRGSRPSSSRARRSGGMNRRIVATKAIGVGSARASRSSSSGVRTGTRSRNRAMRVAGPRAGGGRRDGANRPAAPAAARARYVAVARRRAARSRRRRPCSRS